MTKQVHNATNLPDPRIQLAGIRTAEPGAPAVENNASDEERSKLSRDPFFYLLAKSLFVAYLADCEKTSIPQASALYGAASIHRGSGQPGEFWCSIAVMVTQQMDRQTDGAETVSLYEDRLDTYEEDDFLPRYLLAAHTAFIQDLSLLEYSIAAGINPTMEIGDYWRWLAQKIRREFEFLEVNHLDEVHDPIH